MNIAHLTSYIHVYHREKVVVPENKPFITLSGSKSPDATIISWNDSGDNIMESATLTVLAPHFVGRLLTIKVIYFTTKLVFIHCGSLV